MYSRVNQFKLQAIISKVEIKRLQGFEPFIKLFLYIYTSFLHSCGTSGKFARVLFPETKRIDQKAFNLPSFVPLRMEVYHVVQEE